MEYLSIKRLLYVNETKGMFIKNKIYRAKQLVDGSYVLYVTSKGISIKDLTCFIDLTDVIKRSAYVKYMGANKSNLIKGEFYQRINLPSTTKISKSDCFLIDSEQTLVKVKNAKVESIKEINLAQFI